VSSQHSIERLHLVREDQLLLVECGSVALPHVKLLQANVTVVTCRLCLRIVYTNPSAVVNQLCSCR